MEANKNRATKKNFSVTLGHLRSYRYESKTNIWYISELWGGNIGIYGDSNNYIWVKLRSKWGRFSTNWWGLVSLVPERKILIQGTKSSYCHASMTHFLLHQRVHFFCQKCIFRALCRLNACCYGINCVYLCVSVSENLYFQFCTASNFLIGPWPWALSHHDVILL